LKKPSLLTADDFGSPTPYAQPVKNPSNRLKIPNDSRFRGANDTTLEDELEESTGVSAILEDSDSDVDSPPPKHIILRAKPKEKKSPYMFVRPPKLIPASERLTDYQPHLRRSKRTRFHRPLVLGEKPIYERDENGDYNLVGVSSGYTADPLCKKFNTFDKDTAMERQKQERKRKKRVREQNRAQHEELNKKYLG